MAKIYYRWIKAGKLTIEQVPAKWREEVRGMLEEEKQNTSEPRLKNFDV